MGGGGRGNQLRHSTAPPTVMARFVACIIYLTNIIAPNFICVPKHKTKVERRQRVVEEDDFSGNVFAYVSVKIFTGFQRQCYVPQGHFPLRGIRDYGRSTCVTQYAICNEFFEPVVCCKPHKSRPLLLLLLTIKTLSDFDVYA